MAFNSLIDNGLKAYKHYPRKMMMNKQQASVYRQMMMMNQLARVCKQGVNWNCSYEKVACRVANSFLAEADDDDEEEGCKSLNRTL